MQISILEQNIFDKYATNISNIAFFKYHFAIQTVKYNHFIIFILYAYQIVFAFNAICYILKTIMVFK